LVIFIPIWHNPVHTYRGEARKMTQTSGNEKWMSRKNSDGQGRTSEMRKASVPKECDAALSKCDSRRESEKDMLLVGPGYLIDMVALDDKCDRKSLIATHRETGLIVGLELLPRDCDECEEHDECEATIGSGRCLRAALVRLLSILQIPRRGVLTVEQLSKTLRLWRKSQIPVPPVAEELPSLSQFWYWYNKMQSG
jgi:hypothetical protein